MSAKAYRVTQQHEVYQQKLRERETLMAMNVLPKQEKTRLLKLKETISKRNESYEKISPRHVREVGRKAALLVGNLLRGTQKYGVLLKEGTRSEG